MSEYEGKVYTVKHLRKIAALQRDHAYCPYSLQSVGCVIQAHTPKGPKLSVGANIENAAYGSTVCAERVAVWQTVYHGYAKFADVLVIMSNTDPPISPCGACRQVMAEHLPPTCKVISANMRGGQRKWTVAGLLPGKEIFCGRRD